MHRGSARNSAPTRDRILEAADRLIYEKGFEYLSFADLADAVKIARGNVTFHFPNRNTLLDAVIERRFERTREMLARWEAAGECARDRIRSFIRILITHRAAVLVHGCPVGTLCAELAKLGHPSLDRAGRIFGLFREWLERQFAQLGCGGDSDRCAMQVLAWSQGVATLASALHDEAFLHAEVRRLELWLDSTGTHRGNRRKAVPECLPIALHT